MREIALPAAAQNETHRTGAMPAVGFLFLLWGMGREDSGTKGRYFCQGRGLNTNNGIFYRYLWQTKV
ncbi:hypothetical protein [Paenibacillus macerans]|uniref:hypothetical protein n=1 Tax=Paenibacillus macerans TaxID=44252 RepID=UPI00204103A9|nr:hypothetical protein [Paenibacillus macerans]MCM3702886.1 hypothetical protein [Paenibacillus macerans]